MRKVTGLALLVVGAVVAPLSMAQASTEVTRLPAHNQSVNAITFDPNTGASTGVFVTREKVTQGGGPVDTIFFIVSKANGDFFFGQGVLPKGAFHIDAHSASLDVDTADIAFSFSSGNIPASSISIDWSKADVTRESGSTKLDMGNVHVSFVGTRTFAPATVAGSVLGDELVGATGEIDTITQAIIIVTKD
jgi:hypothetical protein